MSVSIVKSTAVLLFVCFCVYSPLTLDFFLQSPFVVLFSNLLDSLTDACETLCLAMETAVYNPLRNTQSLFSLLNLYLISSHFKDISGEPTNLYS